MRVSTNDKNVCSHITLTSDFFSSLNTLTYINHVSGKTELPENTQFRAVTENDFVRNGRSKKNKPFCASNWIQKRLRDI